MTPRAVAVFGSSEPRPGEAAYETARQLGAAFASRGLAVVNGGYGGVMEAASRGAREAGGRVIGVTTSLFAGRGTGNAWLSETVCEPDLFLRTRTLVARAGGFVVLPGKSGTLAELAFLWALHRAGELGPRPIVLLGEGWRRLLGSLRELEVLEPSQMRVTREARGVEAAVELAMLGMESFAAFCGGEEGE
jgi:uncharacterized protein (TIGR00730 family)